LCFAQCWRASVSQRPITPRRLTTTRKLENSNVGYYILY
jgi:hypothetical protein